MNEQESTEINRIKIPRKVSKPFYIRIEALESIREIGQVKESFKPKTVTDSYKHDGF